MTALRENPARLPDKVDSHAHVFLHTLPMKANRRYTPSYDAPIEHYAAVLDEHAIQKGLLVQPSFLGTDNQFMLDCLRTTDGRFRGVAVVHPSISMKQIQAMHDAGVVGIRLNLVGVETPDLHAASWKSLFSKIRALDWHVEIQCPAERLPEVMPALLRSCSRIVVDHFGLPDFRETTGLTVLDYLCSLADGGRVWVKLSAPYRVWTAQTIHASVGAAQKLLDSFTARRLVWGSDWPHTSHEDEMNYRQCHDWLHRWISDERDLFLVSSSTPKELFRF